MKSCSACGYWKSASAFYPDNRRDAKGYRRSRDGRHHACIECQRPAARERMRAIYQMRKSA